MRNRSFAGVSYQHTLRASVYGELYQGNTTAGQAATVLDVDQRLARYPGFANALTERSDAVKKLIHPNVESIRAAGRTPDGHLAIVSEPISGAITLEELLQITQPARPPQEISAAIASGICAGLAAAHRIGIVHGAVHPRSVLVTREGVIKITDLVIGHTLVNKARPVAADALRGFMAPEISLGGAPTPSADIFAAASIIQAILIGEPTPGQSTTTPATGEVIDRALSREASRRYADADELFRRLGDAFQRDSITNASGIEVSRYIKSVQGKAATVFDDGHGGEGQHPDEPDKEGKKDPLDSLGAKNKAGAVTPLPALQQRIESVLSELEPPTHVDILPDDPDERDPLAELIALAELEFQNETSNSRDPEDSLANDAQRSRHEIAALEAIASLDASLSDVGGNDTNSATQPEDEGVVTSAARYEKSERVSPAPSPASEAPKIAARSMSAAAIKSAPAKAAGSGLSAPAPSRIPGNARADARPKAPPASPVAEYSAEDLSPDDFGKKSGFLKTAFWGLFTIAAVAALFWVVRSQTTLLKQAEKQEARERAEAEAQLKAFNDSQPKPGRITIESEPDEAAVWMLVGRTPTTTAQLPTEMVHELRVELDGHMPKDVRVTGDRWTGSGDEQTANIAVELTPGTPTKAPPAYPPAPPEGITGKAEGKGYISITSEPTGAQVWLLVGITPGVEIGGIAGQPYELKVLKDGHVPKFITISATDWQSQGDSKEVAKRVTLDKVGKRPRGK